MTAKDADLHIHSHCSDSDFSLEEIFRLAHQAQLSCISVTDHDTTAGIDQARRMSLKYNVEYLEGIELSAQRFDVEIHILGYMINPQANHLIDALDNIKEIRRERILKMSSKLSSLKMAVDSDELLCSIKGAIPTRLHLALYMVKKGYVTSIWDAFKKYLSYGKSAYVARFRHTARDAIRIIKESGGLAFLAHPHFLPDKEWIKEFVDWGLDGIEVVYPRYSEKIIARFTQLADSYSILKSGGSDSHGSYKEFTSIGKIKIPYGWVCQLKDAKRYIPY